MIIRKGQARTICQGMAEDAECAAHVPQADAVRGAHRAACACKGERRHRVRLWPHVLPLSVHAVAVLLLCGLADLRTVAAQLQRAHSRRGVQRQGSREADDTALHRVDLDRVRDVQRLVALSAHEVRPSAAAPFRRTARFVKLLT